MSVFVLDRSGKPLMPCREKRARKLLAAGRARVHRIAPFVIRLVDRHAEASTFQPLRLKLDPGSKATGLAVVRDTETVDAATGELQRGAVVLSLMAIVHRGRQISEALTARRNMRRRRRGNLRYRAPRFLNRTRLDTYGFPRGYLMRGKAVRGFQTGDLVRAEVPASSKKAGRYIGRVAVRASGSFNIQTGSEVVQGISHKHCQIIQRGDGYGYSRIATSTGDAGAGHAMRAALSLPGLKAEVSRAVR